MARVEQAIFTSARTQRAAGYHLVAQSSGVCEADARELAAWCPSHDSLRDASAEAASINFHPLPSGLYCVSRTTPAGFEYSGRGGFRVYTQCLLVPPEVLARFANNPFAIIRAAMASGAIQVHAEIPPRLERVHLGGGATAVDQALLARLALKPGAEALAAMVQLALDCACLAVCGGDSGASLVAGLLSCLPVEVRPEFSFTTGLKFSSRRPFRVLAASEDAGELRWLAHHGGVTVLDLTAPNAGKLPLAGWPQWIARTLAAGRTTYLAQRIARHRGELHLDDLHALGLQWLEEFEADALLDESASASTASERPSAAAPPNGAAGAGDAAKPTLSIFAGNGEPDPAPPNSVEGTGRRAGDRHGHDRGDDRGDAAGGGVNEPLAPAARPKLVAAHEAHRQGRSSAATETARPPAPSKRLSDVPAILAKLEQLDDLVFEAIAGRAAALDELQAAWPRLRQGIDGDLLAESREQYLRYALQVWEGCLDSGGLRNPARAVQALEVLCVLFDDV